MTVEAQKPLRIFCSYAHEDEEYLNELRTWLRGLERQRLIEWWHDREIAPGWEWEEAIDKNLRSAEIIILLVTPDFMASDYVFEKEIDKAVERHERGEARVIPIIVRPALWKGTSLDKLQALPKDAKPITRWLDRDDAWLDVAEGIQKAVKELLDERRERAARERYHKAVGEAWVDNKVSDAEAERLAALASELSLTTDTTAVIERNVMGDTKEAILEQSREKERQARRNTLHSVEESKTPEDDNRTEGRRIVREEIIEEKPDTLESSKPRMTSEERLRELEETYEGYTVYDNRGERIGKVDDLFLDAADREEYIGVKMGFLGRKSTLIPMDIVRVNEANKAIQVLESKDHVKDAPSFDDDEDVTPEYEERIRSHFGI